MAEERPPNLRDAEGETACANCAHFQPPSYCDLYGGYPVRPDEVCDDHEPRGGEEHG